MRNFVFTSLLLALIGGIGAANAQALGRVTVPVSGVVAKIKGGQATCVFNGLKPGTYAVAAFHAANDETQMQYGMFGKPKEGYGFSRNPPARMGAPAFASAAFDFTGGALSAPIRLNY
jgi:uncharacterized protein (DUF2141 family)